MQADKVDRFYNVGTSLKELTEILLNLTGSDQQIEYVSARPYLREEPKRLSKARSGENRVRGAPDPLRDAARRLVGGNPGPCSRLALARERTSSAAISMHEGIISPKRFEAIANRRDQSKAAVFSLNSPPTRTVCRCIAGLFNFLYETVLSALSSCFENRGSRR